MNIFRPGFPLLTLLAVFLMIQPAWAQRDQRRGRPHYHPEIVRPDIVKPEVARPEKARSQVVRPAFERSARASSRTERRRMDRPAFEKSELERPEYADNFPRLHVRPPKPEPILEPAPLAPASQRKIVRSGHLAVRGAVRKPNRPLKGSQIRASRPAKKHRP